MGHSFDFDPTNGILRCSLSGEVTDEVLKDFFRTGAVLAKQTHPTAGIIDLSKVTSFSVSAQAVREFSKAAPVLRDPGLHRVIIAPSPQIFGMMRMFEMEGQDIRPDVHVVRTEREAWAILAVEKPRFEPLENN